MIELEQNDVLEETEYDAIELDDENLGDVRGISRPDASKLCRQGSICPCAK